MNDLDQKGTSSRSVSHIHSLCLPDGLALGLNPVYIPANEQQPSFVEDLLSLFGDPDFGVLFRLTAGSHPEKQTAGLVYISSDGTDPKFRSRPKGNTMFLQTNREAIRRGA